MAKVPHTREDHRQPEPVGGGDDVRIAHRAARLNDRDSPCFGNGLKAVREWEESVGRRDRSGQRQHGLLRTEPGRVHPTHLARADTDCLSIAGVHDRVRLNVFAYTPGEQERALLLRGGFARGHGFHLDRGGAVGFLHQQAAGDVLDDMAAGGVLDLQQAQVFC